MRLIKVFGMLIASFLLYLGEIPAQVPGLPDLPYEKPDSTIYFEPARPLILYDTDQTLFPHHMGPHFVFSKHGIGVGAFYNYTINNQWSFTVKSSISNAIGNDEFDVYDPTTGARVVKDKINRLYLLPVDFSIRYFVFDNNLESSFRPFLIGGASPYLLFSTPYRTGRQPNGEVVGFFESFSDIDSYAGIGANFGIGANWGSNPLRDNKVEVVYYYLPFSGPEGNGIESRAGDPITNFGSLFLSLSLGFDL
jgi:hypothetical protein